MLGPAWTGRGRPPAGYFTKRLAENWLRDALDELRFGVGLVTSRPLQGTGGLPWEPRPSTGVTFAEAAAEYLRYSTEDRGCKPSTIRNYRRAIKVHSRADALTRARPAIALLAQALIPVWSAPPSEHRSALHRDWSVGKIGPLTQR